MSILTPSPPPLSNPKLTSIKIKANYVIAEPSFYPSLFCNRFSPLLILKGISQLNVTSKHYFIFLNDFISCGGGHGGGSPADRGREKAGSGSRNYWVLFRQKHLSGKVLKFLFNIHQCLKEKFGSKKT